MRKACKHSTSQVHVPTEQSRLMCARGRDFRQSNSRVAPGSGIGRWYQSAFLGFLITRATDLRINPPDLSMGWNLFRRRRSSKLPVPDGTNLELGERSSGSMKGIPPRKPVERQEAQALHLTQGVPRCLTVEPTTRLRTPQGMSSETTEQFLPRGEELQRRSPCSKMPGPRRPSRSPRQLLSSWSRAPWTATAILVTEATHFPAVKYILDRHGLVVTATPRNGAHVDLLRSITEDGYTSCECLKKNCCKSNREGVIPSGQIQCGNGVVSGWLPVFHSHVRPTCG